LKGFLCFFSIGVILYESIIVLSVGMIAFCLMGSSAFHWTYYLLKGLLCFSYESSFRDRSFYVFSMNVFVF